MGFVQVIEISLVDIPIISEWQFQKDLHCRFSDADCVAPAVQNNIVTVWQESGLYDFLEIVGICKYKSWMLPTDGYYRDDAHTKLVIMFCGTREREITVVAAFVH